MERAKYLESEKILKDQAYLFYKDTLADFFSRVLSTLSYTKREIYI